MDLGIFYIHTLLYLFAKSKISFVTKAVALNCSDLQILIVFLKYLLATMCFLNCTDKKKEGEVNLATPSNRIPVEDPNRIPSVALGGTLPSGLPYD